jgi:hypothetical protein
MVKRNAPSESIETACPACGASIKATPTARRRRVQCPKCREVIFIESATPVAPKPAPTPPPPPSGSADDRKRIESLEARVEVLEAALRDAMTATRTNVWNAPQRQLIWLTAPPGQPPAFSHEQGQALLLNLAGIRSQGIAIRIPAGDEPARLHAEWFKSIFERAGWTVRGPEEFPPGATGVGISLAVPELPVNKDAAATYLALKAAGFDTNPVLDSAPRSEAGQPPTAMALTLSPNRGA